MAELVGPGRDRVSSAERAPPPRVMPIQKTKDLKDNKDMPMSPPKVIADCCRSCWNQTKLVFNMSVIFMVTCCSGPEEPPAESVPTSTPIHESPEAAKSPRGSAEI